MAETAPKRRRIVDPSSIVPVPVYSSQVSRGLKMKAPTFKQMKLTEEDDDEELWTKFSSNKKKKTETVELSDSDDCEEEETEAPELKDRDCAVVVLRSPSPPPDSPVQKQSRKVKAKLNEVDRRLKSVTSLLSPVHDSSPRRRRARRSPRIQNNVDDVIVIGPEEDDDIIMMSSPELSRLSSPFMAEREFPLKVRCRADLNRIPVQPSTPLSFVLDTLSALHGVSRSRMLLLHEEAELSPEATVQELGLGIADIIECVVMADEAEKEADTLAAGDGADIIRVRLQGKDRDSAQEFSLHKDAPLASVFEQYLSGLTGGAKKKVRFHFDGSKVRPEQTPAQLDMEDGDIIEVWA